MSRKNSKKPKKPGVIGTSKLPVKVVAGGTQFRIWMLLIEDVAKELLLLANRALRETIAFDVRGVHLTSPRKKNAGKPMSLSGAVYHVLTCSRKLVPTSMFATLVNAYIIPAFNVFNKYGKSLPVYKKPLLLFHAFATSNGKQKNLVSIDVKGAGDNRQYVIRPEELTLSRFCIDDLYVKNRVSGIVRSYGEKILSAKDETDKKIEKIISDPDLSRKKMDDKIAKAKKEMAKKVEKWESKKAEWGEIEKEVLAIQDSVGWLGDELVLETNLSKKDQGTRAVLDEIISKSGKETLCDSQLKIDGRDLLIIMAHRTAVNRLNNLDPNVVVGIDLGINTPIYCAVNTTKSGHRIGNREELEARRKGFKALRYREQRAGRFGGKVNWGNMAKEGHWSNTRYHTWAIRVVEYAIESGAGTIHAEDLSKLRNKMPEHRKILFCPAKLIGFLRHAAEKVGIKVVEGNPKNSSLRCHRCGHTSTKNRDIDGGHAKDFHCVKCGLSCDADYNAAINIACWTDKEIEGGYSSDDVADEKTRAVDSIAELQEIAV